jgi:Flp pilus assembly pilin Flp
MADIIVSEDINQFMQSQSLSEMHTKLNIGSLSGATGPAGPAGADGATGPAGADGKTVLNGTAAPTTEGIDGDFYIKTDTNEIYGPKTGGVWGSPTSLGGADGTSGAYWSQISVDIDGEAANDLSGHSVSINAAGDIVAIGAYNNDGVNGVDSGHVRVYQNIAGTWSQIGVDIDGEAANDLSGYSVSVNAAGDIVAIGAIQNDGNGSNSGHTRVYQWDGSSWNQLGIDIDGEAAYDNSGSSVSINAAGDIVAIGAHHNDGNGSDSGHVRVYQNIGGTWTQIGADIDGEAVDDSSLSGVSVSINATGDVVAIGATGNDGNGTNSGHVRVYQNIAGTWSQIGADIDGEAAGDNSGKSVSINATGDIVAIGATDGNGSDSGHVRVYQNIGGTWTQIGADIDGEAAYDYSGGRVDINDAGDIVAISALLNDGNGTISGHVRVVERVDSVRTEISELNELIQQNSTTGRDEVQIYSSGDAYGSNSRGSGMHLYGNGDAQHAGNIAFLTGQDNEGDARMIISGGSRLPLSDGYRTNTDTRVTIGNGIWNYVDDEDDKALLTLKNPIGVPALFIEGAGSTEGDIAIPVGEKLSIGTWDGATFTPKIEVDSNGNFIISSISTSSTGLPSGAIYSDGGTLKIV